MQMCYAAVEVLREHEPEEGYFLAFSGGKDSVVIYDLLEKSGCKFDSHFSVTTVDPPELLKFIRDHYPKVEWHRPKKTMFQLIEEKGLPSIFRRWCCAHLKETQGKNRIVITGVRKQESNKRAKRLMFETSVTYKTKRFLNIIIDWGKQDVWDYIHEFDLPYCSLYDNGWERIGCIGCPMSSKKEVIKQFNDYPLFKLAYRNSMVKHLLLHERKHETNLKDADEWIDWWISRLSIDKYSANKEQLNFDWIIEC